MNLSVDKELFSGEQRSKENTMNLSNDLSVDKELFSEEYSLKENIDYIPKIYEYFEFGYLMEYKLNYIPLYQYLYKIDKLSNEKIIILENVIKKLNNIHRLESTIKNKIIFFNDIKKEIYDKVITRKKSIDDLLNYFGEIQYVNDIKILPFEVVLEKCKNIIINYYNTLNNFEYNIILGDCNFSNILINPNNINDIIFIDPRGYFGDTSIFGLKEYDYSKILYAISGYDLFNSNYFNIDNINNKSLNFKIESIDFDKKIINKYFNKVHKAFMIIHWLCLADYNKNNIWKCLVSYYNGLYLGTLL